MRNSLAWQVLNGIGGHKAGQIVAAEHASISATAGYDGHRIQIFTKDLPYRTTRVAPMTVYPIEPMHVGALVTGRVVAVVELFVDRLLDELRSKGAHAVNLLAEADRGHLPDTIIRWTFGANDHLHAPQRDRAVGD